MDLYIVHHGPERDRTTIVRVIGKGLSADEMSDRIHVVVDGIDGRVHYAEMTEAHAQGVKIGSIVEIGQAIARPKKVDCKIAELAYGGSGGIYDPLVHLSYARDMEHVPGGDPEDYVRSHIRRLEALRRAGIVERLDNDGWRIPNDYQRRAQDYDTQRTKQLGVPSSRRSIWTDRWRPTARLGWTES
jgi:hypothetical protein